MKFWIFLISGFIINSGCIQQQFTNGKLCGEFYKLNRSRHFEELFNVEIGHDRVQSLYNEQSKRYKLFFTDFAVYAIELHEYISMPIFQRKSTLAGQEIAFNRCSQKAKKFLSNKLSYYPSKSAFQVYIAYVNRVWDNYSQITTPQWFSSENIPVHGNPELGKFITFTLNKNSKCYYVKDLKSLTPYWSNFFKSSHKLDNNWYYSVIQ